MRRSATAEPPVAKSDGKAKGTKRLLVNVVEPEESRVAIVEDGLLLEYYLEETVERRLLGNIYLGRVVNIEAGIQAAFIDIGESKSAFLHVSDLHHAYAGAKGIPLKRFPERLGENEKRPLIQDLLRKGQTLLVQVTKESIGHKGPSVTTFVSLPGRYLVLMAGMTRCGVSRKIEDTEQRDRLRKIAAQLPEIPNMGVIVRTAGADQAKRDIERDLRYLRQMWQGILSKIPKHRSPYCLYEESSLVIRTVRDLFEPEIREILVDSEEIAEEVRQFLKMVMPRYSSRVKFHSSDAPLFHKFNLERQIDTIYDRKVPLQSGGSLVIEETEALVAIDVNSGRYRKEDDLEKTALLINTEAAEEIARQLRLRDLGGVVICDFIDMTVKRNIRQVETALRKHLRHDRSKTWFSRMSRFGIIEMTRQRLRPSKQRVAREVCPCCEGRGTVRSARSLATSILRQLKRGLGDRRYQRAVVTVGEEVQDHLLNDKRESLVEIEQRTGKRIHIRNGRGYLSEEFDIDYD